MNIEENNYCCKKLQKDYDRLKESESYKALKNKLFEKMKVKYPERIKSESQKK